MINRSKIVSLALSAAMLLSMTSFSVSALAATTTPAPTSALKYGDAVPLSELEKVKVSDLIDQNGESVGSEVLTGQPANFGNSDFKIINNYSDYLKNLNDLKILGQVNEYTTEEDFAYAEDAVADEPTESVSTAGRPGDSMKAPSATPATEGDYSTTNVQVAGVDEADVIKTDGKYIYYLGGENKKGITIVSATNGSMKEVGYISCGEYNNFTDMFISGDKLIVVAQYFRYAYRGTGRATGAVKDYSAFYVYNIKNRAKPSLDRIVRAEGYILSTRFTNNTLYFVTNKYCYGYAYDATLAEVMPGYSDNAVGQDFYAVPTKKIRILPDTKDYSLMIIGSFNIDERKPASMEAFFGAGSTMYMNKNSLYVVRNDWYSPKDESVIYRFAVGQKGLTYSNMGRVSGFALNQYSMDEYNGYFRIATHSNTSDTNNMFVLNRNTMKQTGSVTGLAKGERIQSVRFMGDTGYVVTFRNTDPLFVIDLAKPSAPKVVGELKIPGFSQYLHPIGNGYLVGIGRETTETFVKDSKGKLVVTGSMDRGLKVSLFDVRNPQKPREVAKKIIGGTSTYTMATSKPQSIMFDLTKNRFAFPINYNDYDNLTNKGAEQWNGGIVISVDTQKGFNIIGKMKDTTDSYYYYSDNTRFVYIGNTLYFAAGKKLTSYNYTTFKKLSSINLYTLK